MTFLIKKKERNFEQNFKNLKFSNKKLFANIFYFLLKVQNYFF